jgi:hypothetical protein
MVKLAAVFQVVMETVSSPGRLLKIFVQGLTICTGNGALNCVAQADLECDAAIIERGKSVCRFKLANGKLQDGTKQITSLSQAKLN